MASPSPHSAPDLPAVSATCSAIQLLCDELTAARSLPRKMLAQHTPPSSPRIVVSTAMDFSASPFGFSAKSCGNTLYALHSVPQDSYATMVATAQWHQQGVESSKVGSDASTHNDIALIIDLHQTKVLCTLVITWQAAQRDVSICLPVVFHKLQVVHTVPVAMEWVTCHMHHPESQPNCCTAMSTTSSMLCSPTLVIWSTARHRYTSGNPEQKGRTNDRRTG